MLYLNANEEKRLTFEVDVHGVESNELHGSVRFHLFGVDYGFVAEIEHKKITAYIPPLTEVVGKEIEDGTVVEARLELYTDVHYFKPWEGEIKLGAPMQVKAELSIPESDKKHIKTKLLTSENSEYRKRETKKNISGDDRIDRLEKLVEAMAKQMMSEDKNIGSKKEVIQEVKNNDIPVSKSNKKWSKKKLKNITEEEIIKFMERAGTKNKTIQEIILNEARANAKSGDKYKVFLEVVKTLRKPKSK